MSSTAWTSETRVRKDARKARRIEQKDLVGELLGRIGKQEEVMRKSRAGGGGAERVEQSGAAPTMDGVVRLSTAATQTELSMDALAKLEENQAELKVDNRRLRQRGYQRKYNRKLKRKAFERKLTRRGYQEMMRLQRFCLSTRVNKETRKQKLLERKRKLKLAAPKLPGLADATPEASEHCFERVCICQNDFKSTTPSQNVEELAVGVTVCLDAAAWLRRNSCR